MPWDNVPEDKWGEMESCVKKVMGDGKSKESAIAICHSSIVKGKELTILPDGATMDELIRIAKAVLDAPEATDKATYTPPRGTTTGGSSEGTPGGARQSGNDSKLEKCYLRMKKLLGGDEAEARKICHRAMTELAAKEASPESFTVTKQADGRYRWLIVSSSSFQDRDREIVSQAALEADTDRMNATKEYGTLDWWHTPVRLGACDFSAMHGRLSVESGTFDDPFIAEKLSERSKELAASRSFRHSLTEPDATRTYNRIHTFARALLPRGKESNILTNVSVTKESQMFEEKIKELKALLGGNKEAEAKVDALLADATKAEQSAVAAGIAHKEEAPKPEATPEPAPESDKPAWFLADMKPEEFGALIGKAMQTAIEPLVAQVKELQGAQETAVKENGTAIVAEITKVAQKQANLEAQVAMLNGLTPKAFRASQAPETVTDKTVKGPADDMPYIAQFVQGFVGGHPTAPKP